MAFYDFDSKLNPAGGLLTEQIELQRYAYFKTPLFPAATSTVATEELRTGCPAPPAACETTLRLKSTEIGDATNDPTDIQILTSQQAARSVQVFLRPEYGYLDGKFSVVDNGVITGFCNDDRQFLIGGDAGLCRPPPSMPPSPPPPSPPPSLPPSRPPSPPPAPPPVPPPPSPPCSWLGGLGGSNAVCNYGVIVQTDAFISSHTHRRPFAIGGLLGPLGRP